MKLADLDLNKMYTYFDYLKWTFDERVELIKGHIFEMAAPNRVHQKLSSYIHGMLFMYLREKRCDVYSAPFDVRITRKTRDDKDIFTVLQPDICVICDKSKLDDKGCIGAPDIVVEILSPSNNKKELDNKYDIYEEAGVKEYWIIYPAEKAIMVYTLNNGKYSGSKFMFAGEMFSSTVLEGFKLDVKELFDSID